MSLSRNRRIEDSMVQRAALYIRVSSEEQAMHGLSLLAQKETLMKYAQDNGLYVAGIYADEGVTARKKYSNRAGFMRMLHDVKAGKIDVILFIKLDRWFRNIADYYEVQKVLDEHHVSWIATEEQYDTTTANGRLHLNIKLSIAQDESDRTSERIKFVFDSKVKRGEVVSGKVPLGYRIVDKRPIIDPETGPIAQDIFNKYVAIRSISGLRRYIIDTYGMVYCFSGLKALLRNQRYTGHAHGQDNFYPPLIDPQLFATVQTILTQRAQRNMHIPSENVYLFTSLAFCAECGNRLSAHIVEGKYIYYRCTRHEKYHNCEHGRQTKEETLEDWLLHNLLTQFDQYNTSLATRPADTPVKQVDEAKIRRKMEKLKDLYLNDLIERETYERDFTALRDELHSTAEPPKPRPKPVDLQTVSDALSVYSELSLPLKREFWTRIIGKIVITNDNDLVGYLRTRG